MDRRPVTSSNLASVGYDDAEQVLEVEFHNRAVYQYFGVQRNVYDALMSAASKGSYLHHYIGYSYRYRRVA